MSEIKKIGKRKYEALKKFNLEDMNEDDLMVFNSTFKQTLGESIKQIEAYEKDNQTLSEEQLKKNKERLKRIRQPEVDKEKVVLTKDMLWGMFKNSFKKNEWKEFDTSDPTTIENIKPLFYYFIGDIDNFKKCQNVSSISKPDLRKGLLIIGGYGNGKTSIMRALETCFINTNLAFRGYTTNELVSMYESCEKPMDKDEFNKKMNSGTRYFDDVMTEREASNYGKANLLKDILEERYNKRLRTYISLNYKQGTGEDLEQGLLQLSDKYGSRIYDRIFDMFNVVQFKGKSFRV